jgi:diguanylate cyclase (GGDEF)-like protein/PAS domain S-box-containing protein
MVPPAKRPALSTTPSRVKLVSLLTSRRRNALAVAALLFGAILALRFVSGTAGDAISFLYVVPVVIVAISLGERGGIAAGLVAFALASLWVIVEDVPVGPLGYLVRIAVFALVGGLVGRFADELRGLEAESARHFNLSLDMVCVAGFDGRFKRVNPAFEQILGYSAEELLSRPFADFVHPEDRERTAREAAAIPDGNGTVQFRNRYLDKWGRVHWMEWMSVPLPDEGLIYAVARDVTDRKLMEDELQRLSQRDPLTGLYNRRYFDEQLRRQLAYTRRYGKGGALLLVDLDRFKEINDGLGHSAGDQALCEMARLLEGCLRQTDLLASDREGLTARLGGDEFAVLLPEAGEAGAMVVADRLLAKVGETTLTIEGTRVQLAISIGIALFDEYGIPNEEDLISAADRAMYAAKAEGGAGISLASNES